MRKKALLCLFVAVVLAVFLFAACSKSDNDAEGEYGYLHTKESITYSDGNRPIVIKYTYDEKGNVTEKLVYRREFFLFFPYMHRSSKYTYEYDFDDAGRVERVVISHDYNVPPFSIMGEDCFSVQAQAYVYDDEGRLVKEGYVDPEGEEWADPQTYTEYVYDEEGKLIKKVPQFGDETVYTYDDNGRMIKEELMQFHKMVTEYFYLEDGKLEYTLGTHYDGGRIGYNDPLTVMAQSKTEYTYDGDGNVVEKLHKNIDVNNVVTSTATTVYSDFVKIKK